MILGADLAALLAAPAVHGLLRRHPATGLAVHDLSRTAVAGIVLLHVLPHAWQDLGVWALLLLVGGALGTFIAERKLKTSLFGWAVSALLAHHLVDGAALALAEAEPGLGAAVILHALPIGLVSYRLGLDRGGPRAGMALVAMIALATLAGFGGMRLGVGAALEPVAGMAATVLAGALLHAVTHLSQEEGPRLASGLGVALGLCLLVGLLVLDPVEPVPGSADTLTAFVALLSSCAPALLASFAGAALIRTLSEDGARSRSFLGRLLEPELGMVSLFASFPLLGWPLALARAALWGVGLLSWRWRQGPARTPPPRPEGPWRRALQLALRELPDETLPGFFVGLGVAATLEPLLDPAALQSLGALYEAPGAPILVLALLAVPLLGGASGATPIAAVLLYKGAPPGAVLAFLLSGRAATVALAALLARQISWRRAAAWLGAGLLLAVAAGWLMDALLPRAWAVVQAPAGPMGGATLAVLALGLAVLLRRGMAGVLSALALAPSGAAPQQAP